jgi:hypothetical protein
MTREAALAQVSRRLPVRSKKSPGLLTQQGARALWVPAQVDPVAAFEARCGQAHEVRAQAVVKLEGTRLGARKAGSKLLELDENGRPSTSPRLLEEGRPDRWQRASQEAQ